MIQGKSSRSKDHTGAGRASLCTRPDSLDRVSPGDGSSAPHKVPLKPLRRRRESLLLSPGSHDMTKQLAASQFPSWRPHRLATTVSYEMLALINRLLDWFRSLFWKEEMELTLVGLQYSGKTTFVNVIAVSSWRLRSRTVTVRAQAVTLYRSQKEVSVRAVYNFNLSAFLHRNF